MTEMILPLGLFALSMCITPGPNNMMLTASGANFGFRRTIPHIVGIELGLLLMIGLSGIGLGILFTTFPVLRHFLKAASISYLLYLSFRIAISKKNDSSSPNKSQPLTLVQAAIFQIINPKVLIMATTSISTFSAAGTNYAFSVILIITVFGLVCVPAVSLWAGFGTIIGKRLNSTASQRIFNIAMGSLTAGSVLFMV